MLAPHSRLAGRTTWYSPDDRSSTMAFSGVQRFRSGRQGSDRKEMLDETTDMFEDTSGFRPLNRQLSRSWFSYPPPVDAVKPTYAVPSPSTTVERSTVEDRT